MTKEKFVIPPAGGKEGLRAVGGVALDIGIAGKGAVAQVIMLPKDIESILRIARFTGAPYGNNVISRMGISMSGDKMGTR